ncbi:MAG: NAD(P)/FAD-dependent oxidoreductase, partial [Bacteriovoracaceae bacterium]
GLEGGGVYALSNHIRDEIERGEGAKILLDLKPGLSKSALLEKLGKRKAKDSLSNHLRKTLGLGRVENILLKELVCKEDYQNPQILAGHIKRLGIELFASRPIDEAISTSGGVKF